MYEINFESFESDSGDEEEENELAVKLRRAQPATSQRTLVCAGGSRGRGALDGVFRVSLSCDGGGWGWMTRPTPARRRSPT